MKTNHAQFPVVALVLVLAITAVACDRVDVRPSRLTVNTTADDGDDGTGVTAPKRWVTLAPLRGAAGQANVRDGTTEVLWDWTANSSIFDVNVDPGPSPETIADAEGTSEVEGQIIVRRTLFGRGDVNVRFRVDTKTRVDLDSGTGRVYVVVLVRPASGNPVTWRRTYDYNELAGDPTQVNVSVDGQPQSAVADGAQHNASFERTLRLSPGRHFVSIAMTVYSTADTRTDLRTEGSLHANN